MALAVVPRGFGNLFQKVLPAPSDLIQGGESGEAAVDFLLVEGHAACEWLRQGGFPVIGVMALVLHCEACIALDDFKSAIADSTRWNTALKEWQAWRGVSGTQFDMVPNLTFRATVLREENIPSAPSSDTIARATAAGVCRRWDWKARMRSFDIEVCTIWLRNTVLVAVPLTLGWNASGKKGFFHSESPSYVSSLSDMLQLRSSVCFGLLLKSDPQPGNTVVDPMCGVGSIPAELLVHYPHTYALAGDVCRKAAHQASCTSQRCQAQLHRAMAVLRWDIQHLPLRSRSVDRLVTDYPWGNATKADPCLLTKALKEIGRVLAADGVAVILILRTLAKRICRTAYLSELVVTECTDVVVSGWPAAMITLRLGTNILQKVLPAHDVKTSPVCCTVLVDDQLADLILAEILVDIWPQYARNQGSARRAIRHGRVCLESSPLDALWWRNHVNKGARIIFRPHVSRYQKCAVDLHVLWETDAWMAVVKPPGMKVLQGLNSLSNVLHYMHFQRDDGTPPWTPAYDGDARVGGAWLVAKSPLAAVALLDGDVGVELEWRVMLKGAPATIPGIQLTKLRTRRSVRYKAITEASFTLSNADTHDWRNVLADVGHPVVGDRPHCDGPTACLWVSSVSVPIEQHSAVTAATPERFQKLFDREEEVCQYADKGMLIGYALRMAQEHQENESMTICGANNKQNVDEKEACEGCQMQDDEEDDCEESSNDDDN